MSTQQGDIFFSSDFHFSHSNIVRGCTQWKEFEPGSSHQKTRDFDTLEEHDETLIRNINSVVKKNDTLYFLGDWSFGGKENIVRLRNSLSCDNIHTIYGNHDDHIRKYYSNTNCFSSCQDVLQLSIKIGQTPTGKHIKQRFFLSHYSHQVWPKSNRGSIHLFGHSHGTLKNPIGRSMDVGIDTNNLKPYHLDEILDRMKNVEMAIVDHHNQNTN